MPRTEITKSLPGDEFADGPVGQFMALLGDLPMEIIVLIPGVIIGGIALAAGAGSWSLAWGIGGSVGYILVAPKFIS